MIIHIVTQESTNTVVINNVNQQLSESYISFSPDRMVIRAANDKYNETVRVEHDIVELNTPQDYVVVIDRWQELPNLENWYGAIAWFNQRQAMLKLENAVVLLDSENREVKIYASRNAVVSVDGEQQYGSYATYFTQYSKVAA